MIRKQTLSIPKTLGVALVMLGVFLSAACGEDAPPPPPAKLDFPVKVSVTDDDGVGIPKVPVLIDGKPIGYTDREGTFAAKLNDQAGRNVTLSLGLLVGYKHTAEPVLSEVLKVNPGTDGAVLPAPLSLDAKMNSTEVKVLIWMNADCDSSLEDRACANLPVKVNDEVVTNTDAHGHAHFTYTTTPNKTLKVTLDTPAYSSDDEDSFKMEPFKPDYEIKVGKKPEVFVIEEGFKSGLEGNKRKRTRKRRRPATRKKVRRVVRKKKKKKKKKKGNSSVIDIF